MIPPLIKLATGGIAAITGTVTIAAADAVAGTGGVENHLTLATAAVAVVVVLWGVLVYQNKQLVKAKDDQITALRLRESEANRRANTAEAALRDELADRAHRAEDAAIHGQPPQPPRQSRRHD